MKDQRAWLLETAGWNYDEYEWSDDGTLKFVRWRFRDVPVEIDRHGWGLATSSGRAGVLVVKQRPPTSVRADFLLPAGAGIAHATWRPLDADQYTRRFNAWFVDFNAPYIDLNLRDQAEHMVIDLLAQLRLRKLL